MGLIKNIFGSFAVADLEEAQRFYESVLGLDIDLTPMGLTLVLPSGARIFVYPKDDHQPAVYTILNFEVADIDKAVAELRSRGVAFKRFPGFPTDENGILRAISNAGGPDIAWFEDPSGNILSIIQAADEPEKPLD